MIVNSKISLDSVTWTPLIASIDAYHVEVVNPLGVVLKVRTNSADANTEQSVQSLQSAELTSRSAKNSFVTANQPLAYGQLATGSGSVLIRAER